MRFRSFESKVQVPRTRSYVKIRLPCQVPKVIGRSLGGMGSWTNGSVVLYGSSSSSSSVRARTSHNDANICRSCQ